MKGKLAILAALASLALATPDCYDFSVTTMNTTYMEVLPEMLYFGHTDWMTLNPYSNCGFYTYGDVFIKTYSSQASAIYFVFKKKIGSTVCTLNSTMHVLPNESWLYANSFNADPLTCGYYVGVANSGANATMINVIRSMAEYLKPLAAVTAAVLAVAFV